MLPEQVRGTCDALLIFADVIDSSKFSAVLEYETYAERIIEFQGHFDLLARRYFRTDAADEKRYLAVNVRGDEGTVFVVAPDNPSDLVLRAVSFLYHLKGRLSFAGPVVTTPGNAPSRIGIGAGVHFGRVAYATKVETGRSLISRIEGYSINYAKRVESCSRLGHHSQILLSQDAVRLLEGQPIAVSHLVAPMKGIQETADLYEVRAALLSGLMMDPSDAGDEAMISTITNGASDPTALGDPWTRTLAMSVLDVLLARTPVAQLRTDYRRLQLRLAWYGSAERDPVLLYARAKHLSQKRLFSHQARYLREIAQSHPDFVPARKRLVEACWALAKTGAERDDLAFARDVAMEFLEHFDRLLTPEERKKYQAIVKSAGRGKKPGK